MGMEEKNILVKQYITECGIELNNKYPGIVDDNKINRAIAMFTNSEKSLEELKEQINELISEMIKNYNRSKDDKQELHYDLNDYFDCRVSNDTLHIHVVPKDIKQDLMKMKHDYYGYVETKLEDALRKIPDILSLPENANVKTIFAVSPLLRTAHSQEMFKKYGFDVSISHVLKFKDMFQGKRIGQAVMNKDKFVELYGKKDTLADEKSMMLNLDKAFQSEFIIEMLKNNWNQAHNISVLGNIIGEVYNHMIIHKDGYGFEDYMKQMESLYSKLGTKQIDMTQFDMEKAKIISSIIAKKIGIDTSKDISYADRERIKLYYLNEYVENGYVAHSFPEAYRESIMQNGLIASPEQRSSMPDQKQEIQEIFMNKGIAAPIGGYPYYGGSGIYYEYDFTKVFQHAINSPEWFNWFTSSDHLKGFQSIEKSPYILRDEQACKRNVLDLCENAELSEKQTETVMQFYQESYAEFSSPILNVGLIPKKVVGKSDVSKAVPSELGLLDTIIYTMRDKAGQYIEHQGNVHSETINPSDFKVSHVPSASKYMKVDGYERETKEHLTDSKLNLEILKRAEENKDRMPQGMAEKVEETKLLLKQKQDTVKANTKMSKKAFDKRSQAEILTAQQIKEKNMAIKKRKEQQKSLEKPKVKILTKTNNEKSSSSSSSGFVDILMLVLISGFVAGAIFMIIYIIMK